MSAWPPRSNSGRAAVLFTQGCAWRFTRAGIGRKVSDATSQAFPLGYFMIAEKADLTELGSGTDRADGPRLRQPETVRSAKGRSSGFPTANPGWSRKELTVSLPGIAHLRLFRNIRRTARARNP